MADTLYFSKYNIFSGLRDSDSFFILNLLTGNADILDAEEGQRVLEGKFNDRQQYIEKGYLADRDEEEKLFRNAYLDFIDQMDKSEIQLFYVPHYTCNFRCSYCYQGEYEISPSGKAEKVSDAFFTYIDSEFAGRKRYITIFGGEPLLSGKDSYAKIEELADKASERDIDIAVVTNGYNLKQYLPLFRSVKTREIQVTLDGTEEVHDRRRPLASGGKSFRAIVDSVDAAMAEGHTINLRVVLDRENIESLPSLAKFAMEKGWTSNPLFKTQLGRNYELHTCHGGRGELFSRTELYGEIYRLLKKNPEIIEFHKPAFSVSSFLFENGYLPDPLFDSCPGCKTEWAFDYTGRIYSCTATVGKAGEEIGRFYPEKFIDTKKTGEWEKRNVLSIPECRNCSLQLACGGGCASVAKNRTGKILSPDCRPVKTLLEMGLSYYLDMEDKKCQRR